MAIDGTHELDSVVFGRELEKAGWKNLLRGTIARRPPAPGARVVVDPLHPFMPIFDTDGEKTGAPVVVVCPSGLSGSEDHPHWSRYPGDVSLPNGRVLKGAKAAAELSARYAGTLLLRPAIQHSKALGYHLADPAAAGSSAPVAADLLYVSSHGWLGGFMGGNWPELAVSPGGDRVPFATSYYFVIGRAARDGLGFSGPRWIVLAQCSTLNSATWPLWAAVLQNSSPHVRGILAYEESAPGSSGAATLARSFVSKLRAGMPLLKAWIAVNKAAPAGRRRGRKWAAIVHEAARSDRLQDFGSFQPFVTVTTTASSGPYRGYLDTNTDGTPIRIKDPPFAFGAEMEHRGVFYPIDPARLDTNARYANAASNGHLRLTVAAPAGEALKAVRLDLIHIRPTYRPQISWAAVFSQVTATPTAVPQGMRSSSLSIALRPSASKVVLLCSFGDVESSGLERDHSYLWFRVGVRTESGMRLSHDFKTIGVVY
ncbi:MAG: hypothetical protein SFX73_08585 [Kofleriaceae bacterium]|nr:hypothetical protein [Kofleriaceae bacterium]